MKRHLVFLLALLCAASAYRHCNFAHRNHDKFRHTKENHNQLFDDISNQVIELDRKVQNHCTQNSNGGVQEIVDADNYQIIVPLGDVSPDQVDVKIKHRVLNINANKPDKKISVIRMLPSFVDTKQASFTLSEGKLTVTFNNKLISTNGCGADVDGDVITVPKAVDQDFFATERMESF